MARLFGTDGVRGAAGRDLTARLAMDLAAAAGGLLTDSREFGPSHQLSGHARAVGGRPVAVVGRDPRASGEFLEAAVVAGLASVGVDVLRLGVLPTPAVAYLTGSLGADLGVVLSASHNPAPDNGIKFFARGGFKLPDVAEDEIEERLQRAQATDSAAAPDGRTLGGRTSGGRTPDGRAPDGRAPDGRAPGAGGNGAGSLGLRDALPGQFGVPALGFGRVSDASDARERYLRHLISTLRHPASGGSGQPAAGRQSTAGTRGADETPSAAETWDAGTARPLGGLRVVVDCAHGAAFDIAPRALHRAGAEVITIGAQPDGLNINDGCGSTHLETLAAAVVQHGADAGIAHDGDADRCLAISADGRVVDGDQILAILALELKEAGRLTRDTVVATVMSNLGFRLAMREAGISVVDTAVGDRYVLEAMRQGGYVLGGEQSGHVILLDHATTGDGVLTALHVLSAAARRGMPLGELAKVMTRFPQVLVNVKGVDKARAGSSPEIAAAVAEAETELGDSGRVLIRPSGTEPAVRVMVEAATEDQAGRVAGKLADTVRSALGQLAAQPAGRTSGGSAVLPRLIASLRTALSH